MIMKVNQNSFGIFKNTGKQNEICKFIKTELGIEEIKVKVEKI